MNKYTVYWSSDGRRYEYSYPVTLEQAKKMWEDAQKRGNKYGGYSAGDNTKNLEESNKKANRGPIKMAAIAGAAVLGLFLIYKLAKK